MPTPQEKLAQSLAVLKGLEDKGIIAIHTKKITRTHRERLLKNGFIKEVIKGWYIPARPEESAGECTAWYTSFWGFCADYLNSRFDDQWCLSSEQSLSIIAGRLAGAYYCKKQSGASQVKNATSDFNDYFNFT